MSGPPFGVSTFRLPLYLREGDGIDLSQPGPESTLIITGVAGARSVLDFGAVGDATVDNDGVGHGTDDGDALNRAADWLRDQVAAGERAGLDFLDRNYLTTKSLNFTAMAPGAATKTFLVGSGARVIGKCVGKAIFDCLGSSNLSTAGIITVGDSVDTPRFGFQYGRYNLIGAPGTYRAASAGGNTLVNCGSEGTFTGGGKYNNASEVFLEIGCNWYNDSPTVVPFEGVLASYAQVVASPFSHISDSGNHFDVQSDYVTVTQPVGGENSYLNQVYINCSFRRLHGGSPLYMSLAQGRVTMIGCYAACLNGDAVIIGCNRFYIGSANYRNLSSSWNLHLHVEADSLDEASAFLNVFRYIPQDNNSGSAILLVVDNFTWIENKSAADEALFRMSSLFPANSRITFRGLHMNVDSFHGTDALPDGGAPNLGIFYPGVGFRIATMGHLKLPVSVGGPVIADTGFYLTGDFFPRSATATTTIYPKGSYRNANSILNTGSEYHKGNHVFWGDMDASYVGTDFPPLDYWNFNDGSLGRTNAAGTISWGSLPYIRVNGADDGVTDDTAAVQTAFTKAAELGINKVVLGSNHLLTNTILITGLAGVNGSFTVEGNNCKIMWNGGDKPVFAQKDYASINSGGNDGIVIQNMVIDDFTNTTSRVNNWTIDLSNGAYCRVINVEIDGKLAAPTTDKFGIIVGLKPTSTYSPATWNNYIEKCFIRRGKILVNTTDSTLVGNFVYAFGRDYAIQLGGANLLIGNTTVGGETFGSIYLSGDTTIFGGKITGHHDDGNNSSDTKWFVYAPAAQLVNGFVITGCNAWNKNKEAIRLENALACEISAITMRHCDAADAGLSDVYVSGQGNFVGGLTHYRGNTAPKNGDAVRANHPYAITMVQSGDDPNVYVPGAITSANNNYASTYHVGGGVPSKRTMPDVFDDFEGAVLSQKWATAVGSGGGATSPAIATPFSYNGGAVKMTFGDNNAPSSMATNGSSLYSSLAWRTFEGGLFIDSLLETSSIGSIAYFVGFTDTQSNHIPFALGALDALTASVSDAFGLLFDTAAATNQICGVGVKATVVTTPLFSGVAPTADTPIRLRCEASIGGTGFFFVNNVLIGNVINCVTATTILTPIVCGFSRNNTSKTLSLDQLWVGRRR